MMQQMQAMQASEQAVVQSGAYAKKGESQQQRMHQDDELANELFKAAKMKKY